MAKTKPDCHLKPGQRPLFKPKGCTTKHQVHLPGGGTVKGPKYDSRIHGDKPKPGKEKPKPKKRITPQKVSEAPKAKKKRIAPQKVMHTAEAMPQNRELENASAAAELTASSRNTKMGVGNSGEAAFYSSIGKARRRAGLATITPSIRKAMATARKMSRRS